MGLYIVENKIKISPAQVAAHLSTVDIKFLSGMSRCVKEYFQQN